MPRALCRLSVLSLLLFAACGDPPTSDPRGYTKAPLEKAGPFVRGEVRADVARFARPNLPVAEPIVLPDTLQR
jgi:hypothetical protein